MAGPGAGAGPMSALQGPQGGGTAGGNTQQALDIELQGLKAEGVLGGLPVAEKNQEFFLIFKGIGGTGPEIIDQTAYFIEYLVDSEGNVFKPSENTSALNNLLQNFPVNKPVSVISDNPSTSNSVMAGQQQLTAVGLQQPILYSQTGSSAGAFTGSIFFKGNANLGIIGNDGSLTVPNMKAFMVKTTGFPTAYTNISNYQSFEGGTLDAAAVSAGNARSASLANGKYFITSSAIGDLQSFTITGRVRVKNPTDDPITMGLRFFLTLDGTATNTNPNGYVIPPNDTFVVVEQSETIQINGNTFQQFVDGDVLQLAVSPEGGTLIDELVFDYIKFGVENVGAGTQNPTATGDLLQSAGNNAPPFWLTGSQNSLYITASDWLSVNYSNIQFTSGTLPTGETVPDGMFYGSGNTFGLSKIKVPFNVGVGDRIRFLYNPALDYHIYDVKYPKDEGDGRLKIKINQDVSSSLTLTQMSNFVLHRTNKSIPRYVILNVPKEPGIDSSTNPFTGIVLPQFPTEKLINNLDSILNKLKIEGIIEN